MKDALALALVHFIWQGAALALVAWALMRLAHSPSVRYAIGVATMLAMLAAPVLTFLALQSGRPATQPISVSPVPGAALLSAPLAQMAPATTLTRDLRIASARRSQGGPVPTTWILSLWLVGVVMLSLRLAGGLVVAHRLATRTLTPVGDDLQRLASRLAQRLNVSRAVRVFESASVAMPIMIGWLRPVIVMPPAALAALPLSQLEALLAHEFAHIRRHDYFVNLLQTAIETVCFYHPAVWWTSREVRRHRELCCDDIAVGVCDRLTYVSALSTLASMSAPQLAMAATGGLLRDRIRRLIEPTTHSASAKGGWMAVLPILLVVSFVAPHAWEGQSTPPVTSSPTVTVQQVAPVLEQAKPTVEQAKPIVKVEALRRTVEVQAARKGEPVPVKLIVPKETLELTRKVARRPVEKRAPRGQIKNEKVQTVEARQREVETEQDIAQQRLELERRRKASQSETDRVLLEGLLRRHEITLPRLRELFEKGLATRESIAATEGRILELRQQLEMARMHRGFAEEEHAIRRQELELQHRMVSDRRAVEVHRELPMLDGAAALQPLDQLTIAIASEPDLPTTFAVRADGSIRFPFLGSIRVQGSTTGQVQAVLQKLLSDKGLAQSPAVTVTARRGR